MCEVRVDREQRIYKLKNGSDTAIWAANEIERLEKALRDIRKHQEMIGGSLAKMGAIWHMADNALDDT